MELTFEQWSHHVRLICKSEDIVILLPEDQWWRWFSIGVTPAEAAVRIVAQTHENPEDE